MKLLYEDSTWRIYRKGRKYPVVIIEKFNEVEFRKMYGIHLAEYVNEGFDWWVYGYSICTAKSRQILSTPVANINDIEALINYRSKFKLPVVVEDELTAILMAEKMVQNV